MARAGDTRVIAKIIGRVCYIESVYLFVKIHVIVFESYGYYSVYMFLNVFLFELIRKIIEKAQIGGGCVVFGSKNLEIFKIPIKKERILIYHYIRTAFVKLMQK